MNEEFDTYADWYVWAKRNLSTDAQVCHGAADAATAAVVSGADRQQAIAAARQSLVTAAHLGVGAADIRRRTYAEWFDWARRELGGVREQQRAAARAALSTLDAGGGANAATAAARAAFGQDEPAERLEPAERTPPPAPPGGPSGAAPGAAQPYPPAHAPYAAYPPAVAAPAYAGFGRRLGAWAIDALLLASAAGVVTYAAFIAYTLAAGGSVTVSASGVPDSLAGLLYLAWIVISWLYYTISEASPWQATPGKLAAGIVVTDLQGRRIGWGRANARYWSKLLSALILGIGFLMAAFTERRQALHDMIAATLVRRA